MADGAVAEAAGSDDAHPSTRPRHARSATTAAVALHGLTKRFGAVTAVDHLDLTIEPGEIVAFLGPNGAGKTSTIDMVLGLSHPDAGRVGVFGTTPHAAVAQGLVSAVMQTGGLLKDLTVGETVHLVAALFAHTRPVAEVLELAGLTDISDRRVASCSGGEQQRLRFAMALLPEPDLIILDEPTTGMDVEGRRAFWGVIRADADRRRTIVFATHYLQEADAYADRIVLVSRGTVVADGTAAEIRALSAGRILTATWKGIEMSNSFALRGLPGVEDVELRGDTVLIRTADSDAVARHLLTATPAHDLQITSGALEDAFLALTAPPRGAPDEDSRRAPRRSSVRRLLADLPGAGDPPDAAQSAHDRVPPGGAAGLLPALRRAQRRQSDPARRRRQRLGLHHDQLRRVRLDDRQHERRCVGGGGTGVGLSRQLRLPRCTRSRTSPQNCSPQWWRALLQWPSSSPSARSAEPPCPAGCGSSADWWPGSPASCSPPSVSSSAT
jgi:ABC-2 type transport system ATP-binding protein